ncbi:MAG TPA: patatin-like phospholipase family protein [Acidimicrobiales bacterium]|jgi:predicted acylesterase/phospholipase RssA
MPATTRPGPTAFVLAGGGTKGSFEAGVLQYLVAEQGIVPDIITATSAGALAATVLAQGRTRDELVTCVAEIEEDLLAMTRVDTVFGQQGWLRALQGTSLGTFIRSALTEGTRPPFPRRPTPAEPIGPNGPTRAQRRRARKARRQRRRQLFRLGSGAVWRLPRARRQLRSSGSAVLNLDPLADALHNGGPSGIKAVDTTLIARPGLQLRLAVTALRAGSLRYVTEEGYLVEDDAVTRAPELSAGPISVVEGALASASVPLVFPPRHLADDDYVDGGVLQIIPLRAAVQLGAQRIFAVMAMPLDLSRDERDYTSATAGMIGLRALGMIGMADRQAENLAVPLPPDSELTVIDPVIDVVGYFEIEPGLMRINREYGWLRAADLLADGDDDIRADMTEKTDALVTARVEAWTLEERLFTADGTEVHSGDLALLREHKRHIRDILDARKQLAYPLPDSCDTWWSAYELHNAERPEWLAAVPLDRS